MYDLIIQNGTLVDGSGMEPYRADLAIVEGKIVCIAAEIPADEGKAVLDASGLTVTPGFIDSHSHSDVTILTYPDQREKLEQGITVSVTGQCGNSKAPKRREDGLYKFSDFLRDAAQVPQGSGAVNLVGHGTIRAAVLENENRRPTPDELEQMKALLRDAMEGGAIGMSLGLIYVPGCYADTEELIEMAKVVASYNGIVAAHIRNEGDTLLESVEEYLTVIRSSGARGVVSHLKSAGKNNWGKIRQALEMIKKANEEGCDIHCDAYPYVASSTGLAAQFHPEGIKNVVDLLDMPEVMEKIRSWAWEQWQGDLSWILITQCHDRPEYLGKRISEIAQMRGNPDQLEVCFELIRETANRVGGSFFTMCEEDVERALSYERTMICTDSAAAGQNKVYHPRLRASFVRVIARYTRDRGVVSLQEMIRRMTGLPAQVYGLKSKGRLAPGYDADICIFDYEKLEDCADYIRFDAKNQGLSYVLVAGEVVVEDGVHNGKRRAGILLR